MKCNWKKVYGEILEFHSKNTTERIGMEFQEDVTHIYLEAFTRFEYKVKFHIPSSIYEDEEDLRKVVEEASTTKQLKKNLYAYMMAKYFQPFKDGSINLEGKDPRGEDIVLRHWFEGQTLEQIGSELNLSREGVRRIEEKMLCAQRVYWRNASILSVKG